MEETFHGTAAALQPEPLVDVGGVMDTDVLQQQTDVADLVRAALAEGADDIVLVDPNNNSNTLHHQLQDNSNKRPYGDLLMGGTGTADGVVGCEPSCPSKRPKIPDSSSLDLHQQTTPYASLGALVGTVELMDEGKQQQQLQLQQPINNEPPQRLAAVEGVARKPNNNGEQWDAMYAKLVAYKDQHGDCLVPKRVPKLGIWVETQRTQYKRLQRVFDETSGVEVVLTNKRLSRDRLQRLESIGFAWSAPKGQRKGAKKAVIPTEHLVSFDDDYDSLSRLRLGDKQWQGMFEKLVKYHSETGTTLVPRDYEDQDLAIWVENQRIFWSRDNHADVADPMITEQHTAALVYPEPAAIQPTGLLPGEDGTAHQHAPDGHQGGATAEDAALLAATMGADEDGLSEIVEAQQAAVVAAAVVAAAEAVDDPPLDESPMKLPAQPRLLSLDRKDKLDSLGFVWNLQQPAFVEDPYWDAMFERLLIFKNANGHCMVPQDYPNDTELVAWVEAQRAGTTTEERRKRLGEIGFVWIVPPPPAPAPPPEANMVHRPAEEYSIPAPRNSYDDQWDVMFKALEAYKAKHGNCLVPKRYKENPKLGTWIDTQRVQYKRMTRKLAEQGIAYEGPRRSGIANPPNKPVVGRLTDERIERLESIGFVWSVRDDWDKHFLELQAYKKEYGDCNVPARFAANRRLGIWVSAQRQQMKALQKQTRTAPRLSQDRIARLNELGFAWEIRSRNNVGESWNKRLDELKEFKAQHGTCLVPSRYPPNPELGVWVGTQRTQYRLYLKAKQGDKPSGAYTSMTEERIRLLDEVGFVWTLRSPVDGGRDVDPKAGAECPPLTGAEESAASLVVDEVPVPEMPIHSVIGM